MAELRPSFEIDLPGLAVEDAVARLRTLGRDRFDTEWAKTHVLLSMHRDERHTWSPWLHVDIRREAAGCSVFARFSPKPALWSAFALTYLAFGSLAVFGACFAAAQMLLGHDPWAWWVVLVSVIGAGALFWASQVGQGLAREQMHELRGALEAALSG